MFGQSHFSNQGKDDADEGLFYMTLGIFEPRLQITAGNIQVVCQEAGEEAGKKW